MFLKQKIKPYNTDKQRSKGNLRPNPFCEERKQAKLPDFKAKRTRYESVNYGNSKMIDPHSHKVQTKFYKIPKFGVNRPNSKRDTAI